MPWSSISPTARAPAGRSTTGAAGNWYQILGAGESPNVRSAMAWTHPLPLRNNPAVALPSVLAAVGGAVAGALNPAERASSIDGRLLLQAGTVQPVVNADGLDSYVLRRTGFWYITLAPDAEVDSDAFPSVPRRRRRSAR